jgi:hypothetical protein
MAFKSGKTLAATVNATALKCKSVRVTPKKQDLDVTCSASGGGGDYIAGIVDCDFEIEGDHDIGTTNPIGLTLIANAAVDGVAVTITTATGVTWTFPTAFISSVDMAASVRGLVTYRITGKAAGTYTLPSA